MFFKLTFCSCLLALWQHQASGEDSFFKMRLTKHFLEDVFSQNLRVIFSKLPPTISLDDFSLTVTEERMPVRVTNFHLKMTPAIYDDEETIPAAVEINFRDNGLIILEIKEDSLFVDGSGMLTDPQTGHLEVVQFRQPVRSLTIEMKPEEILSKEEGEMLPRFAITDVNMTLEQDDTLVSVHGSGSGVHLDTPPPLFRTKSFEEAMREWLARETSKTLGPKVRAHLAEFEEGIWKNVPFEYRGLGYRLRYSLADKIKLADNYLEVSINSELYDVDHGEFKEKLRRITPLFS